MHPFYHYKLHLFLSEGLRFKSDFRRPYLEIVDSKSDLTESQEPLEWGGDSEYDALKSHRLRWPGRSAGDDTSSEPAMAQEGSPELGLLDGVAGNGVSPVARVCTRYLISRSGSISTVAPPVTSESVVTGHNNTLDDIRLWVDGIKIPRPILPSKKRNPGGHLLLHGGPNPGNRPQGDSPFSSCLSCSAVAYTIIFGSHHQELRHSIVLTICQIILPHFPTNFAGKSAPTELDDDLS